jgi:predicted ArsR family transcriptional regulator
MYRNSAARERVLRCLLERGPSTVDELARDLEVVPVTMRSHVNALQEQGLLAAQEERGRVGRPRRRYRLTPEAHRRLPSREGSFAAELLDSVRTLAGSRGVDQLLDVAASRHALRYADELAGRNLPERVARVAELLNEESGLARWEESAGRFLLREYHCPYGEAASDHPDVCRYHVQVVTRLTGAPVSLERSIARGDRHCVFAVSPVRPPAAVRTLSDGREAPQRT